MGWFGRKHGDGRLGENAERAFVFVSGHPRSGTNWVSSLLNLHPDVFSDGEFHFLILRWAMDGFTSLPWYIGAQEPVRSAAERGLQQMYRDCLIARAKERGRASVRVLADHTPRLFRIMISPPEARYVIVVRDGRDVLVSYTYHLLNTKNADVIPEPIRGVYAKQLARLDGSREAQRQAGLELLACEPWVRHYASFWSEHILHDQRILQTVRSQGFGGSVMVVSYESLRADVEAGRRAIYRHAGVDPSRAASVSSETNTAPGFGGREDVTSFYRKGEAQDWRNYFSPTLAKWFNDAAGQALIASGYESDARWIDRVGGHDSVSPSSRPGSVQVRGSPTTAGFVGAGERSAVP
jgi:Sulfotransferase domain